VQEEPTTEQRRSVIEQHIQTIITAILLALLIWNGTTMLSMRDDVTTLKVQVAGMEGQLKSAGDDRFRGSDWRREREIIEARFNRIESLLEKHAEAQRLHNGTVK
jgi:hypothetical protein